jgi:hypothetical protein
VRAEDGHHQQQEAKSNRPGSRTVGMGPDTVRNRRPWAPAHLVAFDRRSRFDEHQASARLDLPYSAAHRRDGAHPIAPTGVSWQLNLTFALAAALDPVAHILDISPPGAGLGCSWHLHISFVPAYGVS